MDVIEFIRVEENGEKVPPSWVSDSRVGKRALCERQKEASRPPSHPTKSWFFDGNICHAVVSTVYTVWESRTEVQLQGS